MIGLLKQGAKQGWKKLEEAVEAAVRWNCWDVAAVEYRLASGELQRPTREAMELGWLERFERPLPVMKEYDQLLSEEVGR